MNACAIATATSCLPGGQSEWPEHIGAPAWRVCRVIGSGAGQRLAPHALETAQVVEMCAPAQIALARVPQADRVVMSIEKLIDHDGQLVVRDGSAGWSSNRSAALN